jgi:prevent-host-death family protein
VHYGWGSRDHPRHGAAAGRCGDAPARARDSRQPVVITQRGRAAAVLVSIETYKAAEHERELLRLLAQGDREIAAGKGYDLDSVLTDADELLDRK